MSPGDRSRNKIDYILIQKRFRNAVKTSKSLPEADSDSDHVPVMCKFQIILKKLREAKANPKFQMDLPKSDEKLEGKIFKDDRCKKPKIKENIEGPAILKEEVEAAIKKMKNGKATIPDNIPVEIIKALDNLGIDLT
ncbi:craniofacial development protein 2 [Plakobranchus ocellatus]|uniref:Craniofacial development protein 2 n=1 Tax=Plakobranchus ocellatus TaxID=259542 RepID=A0AAV3ZC98_9GAST|nr:craniofacial development protein 2 [Plakobranchus ocellatus]